MTVTVIDARAARGYSGLDHLLSDDTDEIIGRSYQTVAAALKAARGQVRLEGRAHPYASVYLSVSGQEPKWYGP